ncbi:uncharacterized protein LOC119262748 isoform X1 [Pygocentrus nattereri]|uniref:uncharacterized protein LOC119262748 isoform X1 n=1 Tax=Pygocentrus nattereri TaxID=42514 RepID=UPI001891327B|nr:uncharacterized protein LOC119262748 isoform X1 [Pygocentrus nattereri]
MKIILMAILVRFLECMISSNSNLVPTAPAIQQESSEWSISNQTPYSFQDTRQSQQVLPHAPTPQQWQTGWNMPNTYTWPSQDTRQGQDVLSHTNGGFKLTKWVSNSKKVLEVIPENERANMVKDLELDKKDPSIEKVLGIQWNLEDDTFGFKVSVNRKPLTRRGILSTVSSIYDPLGFLAPFVLKGKQILQALCKSGCGWDKVISDAMLNQWKTWLQDTEHLSGLRINRCMKPKGFGTVISAQLHHFCDASEVGYGTVSYIRFASDRNVHVSLVSSQGY